MFQKGEIMKKYLVCFAISILIVSGCSPSQTTPKDFVNQLEENELFDANKEDRVCYENYFAELAADEESEMDLNRMSKELDNVCEECKKEDESVSQNLILTGFKICKSCRTSKTVFPI